MLCKGVVIEMGRQNDTLETIFKLRRSCRAYNPEMKIPREDLETIVRADAMRHPVSTVSRGILRS